ncbi:MAG: hypothetical protein PQJ59_11985 [Spirochaetales bacterium]|nr:hypothetical protein [Spirochaetales bacterium]
MTEQELQAYAERCSDKLDSKQKKLRDKYGLSGRDEYRLDLETRQLVFEKDGKEFCRFTIIIIGSLAPVSKNWLWGWGNESLSREMRDKSALLKGLYEETGFDLFRTATFKADPNLARELAALAVHHLGAEGLYRVPGGKDQTGDIMIYLALYPS